MVYIKKAQCDMQYMHVKVGGIEQNLLISSKNESYFNFMYWQPLPTKVLIYICAPHDCVPYQETGYALGKIRVNQIIVIGS